MMNKIKTSLVILAMMGAACGKQDRETNGLVKASMRLPATADQMMKLGTFDNCAVADTYIKSNLKRAVDDRLERSKHYYLESPSQRTERVFAPSRNESAPVADSAGPQDFTKTNTQVAGVDEPDMMKTDGKFIYSLSGENVHIVKSWPANDLRKIATIPVNGAPESLFLTEDQKLVLAYHPRSVLREEFKSNYSPWYYDWSLVDRMVTTLAIYDVKNPAAPVLLKNYSFRGNYHDMRRQGDNIRLISTNYWQQFPEGVQPYINAYDNEGRKLSEREFLRRFNSVQANNDAIIAQMDFKKWVKSQYRSYHLESKALTDDLIDKDSYDCRSIYGAAAMSSQGLTTVTSVNLASGSIDQAALLANTSLIYNSEESLYLAFDHSYWWWGFMGQEAPKTFIHKFQFDRTEGSKLIYKASGSLGGRLNDQFSMDEFEGNLRVAITDSFSEALPSTDDSESGQSSMSVERWTTVSRVLVMAEADKKLEIIGQTPDLAKGERIYSARFNGKKAYVVTFRQTDPLFTLDMSDPKNPKVLGELKVNGFSTYIHLMDENHLLTVGQDADPQTGRALGLKITVFDVTDPSKPTELHTKILAQGNEQSWSQASYNHHAFTYFPSRGLLALPISGYRQTWSGDWWGAYFSDLRVYKIDLKDGISEKGGIAMNDLYRGKQVSWDYWWGGATVQRSIFADDYVYAISDLGIRSAKSDSMSKIESSAMFYP